MSQSATWCDHIIIQAVANALCCNIHITDSSHDSNATIVSPISLYQRQKIVFLGRIPGIHYVSTLPKASESNQTDSKRKETLEKRKVYAKNRRCHEAAKAKRPRIDKVTEQKNSKKDSETAQCVTQSKYLNEFDAIKNGPLHDQCWAKHNMNNFINLYSISYSIAQFVTRHGQLPVNQNALVAICALVVLGIKTHQKNYLMLTA